MLTTKQSGKSALGLLLCCLVLFISLLAVSPSLHQLVHPDADDPGHVCVVVLFANGLVAATAVVPILAAMLSLFGGVRLLSGTQLLPALDFQF